MPRPAEARDLAVARTLRLMSFRDIGIDSAKEARRAGGTARGTRFVTRLSIIIPFFNEEMNVAPVLLDVRRHHPDAEIIAVDDHSTDGTPRALAAQEDVRVVRLPRHLGQSGAIYRGLIEASGDICVLMDGDGQCSAGDIKRLIEHFPEYDFVNGRRELRQDGLWRALASRVGNGARNLFTRDGMKDTGGTPKAMKRECVAHLVPFDGLHRFIPAFLQRAGFRTLEVPVSHRERLHGATKYTTWDRALRGVFDLVGVSWILRRRLDASALGIPGSRADGAREEVDAAADPRH